MNWFSKEKIKWVLKRHPMLYYVRYALLSHNLKGLEVDAVGCYNDLNLPEEIPSLFYEVNQKIDLDPNADELEKAVLIATYLKQNIKGGPGLSLSSGRALKAMLAGKGGVCNDFAQIFNNFCVINHIKVKEWSCVERFFNSVYGHTFNEVWSTRLGKWVAIDVSKGLYFLDDSGMPLSVMEMFSRLRAGKANQYHFFLDEPNRQLDRINHIYAAQSMPFLTINYRNAKIDRFLDRFSGKLPVFVITSMMIVLRRNFSFLFVMDDYRKKLLPQSMQ